MTNKTALEAVLRTIEAHPREALTLEVLAAAGHISASHLQRLFRQVTGQTLMDYVRGRKLALGLEALLTTDARILDVALECGFSHEQSFVRAFKAEYGITPGAARKAGKILPIRAAIMPQELYEAGGDNLIYGPQFVMVPQFYLVGAPFLFAGFDDVAQAEEPNRLGVSFYLDPARAAIPNTVRPEVYWALGRHLEPPGADYEDIIYMPSVQVERLAGVPQGMEGFTVPAGLYVYFRYIGAHPMEEITMVTAEKTYAVIERFIRSQTRYRLQSGLFFERIDPKRYDGLFCQMDWYGSVTDTEKMAE